MNRKDVINSELARIDGAHPENDVTINKHRLMVMNPFSFLRGSASLFYADIKNGVIPLSDSLNAKALRTFIMGDCHISNFGFFTEEGSQSDKVIFAPNDFDDACHGPAAWDVLRYLVSLNLAQHYCQGVLANSYHSDALNSNQIGLMQVATPEQVYQAQQAFLLSYIDTLKGIIADPNLRQKVLGKFPKGHVLRKAAKKARNRAPLGKDFFIKSTLAKAINTTSARPIFNKPSQKLKPVSAQLRKDIIGQFSAFVDDCILDVAERVGAGTGSVNLKRYYLLVGPADYASSADLPLCHLVEIKQQRVAAPLQHIKIETPVNSLNAAHLTLVSQQKMQNRPDLILDEVVWQDAHWLIRSRHHAKVGIKPEDIAMAKAGNTIGLLEYAQCCGYTLALAHSRGDRRSTQFEQAFSEQLQLEFTTLIQCANNYAKQSIVDCHLLHETLIKKT